MGYQVPDFVARRVGAFGGKARCTRKQKMCIVVGISMFSLLEFQFCLSEHSCFPMFLALICSIVVRTMLSTAYSRLNLVFERYLQPFGVKISYWYLQHFRLTFLLLFFLIFDVGSCLSYPVLS